ncbi:DNA repair protein recA-like protein, partial [Trifolium medium]|nr:DNA repair protein recA-like protein [Trifolium medium]
YGWWQTGQNDYQGWNQREQYDSGLHNKYQGRNARSGNCGTWDGFNRKREYNLSWSQDPGYHHGANDYQMNRGRRRNGGRGGGGGRRGNFAYVDKVATSGAW